MNRIQNLQVRAAALVSAAFFTVVMLASIDSLATAEPQQQLLAQTAAVAAQPA